MLGAQWVCLYTHINSKQAVGLLYFRKGVLLYAGVVIKKKINFLKVFEIFLLNCLSCSKNMVFVLLIYGAIEIFTVGNNINIYLDIKTSCMVIIFRKGQSLYT